MPLYLRSAFLYLLLASLFLSCRKEGCQDTNAVNYDKSATFNDGFCVYRYLNSVAIRKVNFTRSSTATWDNKNVDLLTFPNEEYPDLKFYLKRKDSNYWESQTPAIIDARSLPVEWEIKDVGNSFLILQDTYEFKLVDEDEQGHEIIFEGSFVPGQVLNDNVIRLQSPDQSTLIELAYIVS